MALRRGPFAAASFRNLFAARFTTVLGSGVAPIALAFAVLDMGGSATELGIVVATRAVANIATLLVSGAIADRVPRRALLVLAALVAGATQAVAAGLVLSGSATVLVLAALEAINGIAAALDLPASAAMTPQTVPAEQLRPANALLRLGVNGGTALGTAFGSAVVAVIGPGWGLAFDAATFVLAAPLFARIRVPHIRVGPPESSLIADLRDGWREFLSRTWVWSIVAQFFVVNAILTGCIVVLGPVVADATFGRASWGLVLASEAVGLLAGSLLALRWRPRRTLFIGVSCVALSAIPLLLLATAPVTALVAVAFFLSGVGFEVFGVAWDLALQQNIPPERLGRIAGYDALGSFAAIPMGEALAGPIAGVIGTRAALTMGAGLILAATGATMLVPSVRRVGTHHGPADVPSAPDLPGDTGAMTGS